MRYFTTSTEAKLWASINVGSDIDCWEWEKGKTGHGYGVLYISVDEGPKRQMLAHRMVCTIEHGPPTKDKPHALHSCDNPPCCNPNHLRWGSHRENMRDAIERGRNSPPPLNTTYRRRDTQPKGEDVWNQTLTEDKVREIWRLHLLGGINSSEIAKMVEAKQHAVYDLVRGRSWRHLEGAPSLEALKSGGVRRGYNQFTKSC